MASAFAVLQGWAVEVRFRARAKSCREVIRDHPVVGDVVSCSVVLGHGDIAAARGIGMLTSRAKVG